MISQYDDELLRFYVLELHEFEWLRLVCRFGTCVIASSSSSSCNAFSDWLTSTRNSLDSGDDFIASTIVRECTQQV